MFNLIMAGSDERWEVGIGVDKEDEYSLSRFLEYTAPSLVSDLTPVSDATLLSVTKIPALFMSEIKSDKDDNDFVRVRTGQIVKASVHGKEIRYTFKIEQNLGSIKVKDRRATETALGMDSFELHRTHWAIKGIDLNKALEDLGWVKKKPSLLKTPTLPKPLVKASPPNPIIDSLQSFTDYVLSLSKLPHEEIFYRGHSDKAHRLIPSLFRKNATGGFRYLPREDTLVREMLTAHAPLFDNDLYMLDKLVRMQHFGLPTRLLDVSSNPLVALYFACADEATEQPGKGQDGELIILTTPTSDVLFYDSDKVSCLSNLCLMNFDEKNRMDTKSQKEDFNKSRDGLKLLSFVRREKPYFVPEIAPQDLEKIVFVRGRNTHERIQAQSGAFLLFGKDAILEETGHSTLNVRRATVRNKRKILSELEKFNIKTSTIYPGIERVAMEIARRHELLS